MEKQTGIYIVTNMTNSKQYVGQTYDFQNRLRGHFCEANKENPRLLISKAIKKYGKESFKWVHISYDKNELDEMEKFWIKKLDTRTPNGYNLTDGGHLNRNLSEISIEKMRNARLGKIVSEKTKDKLRKIATKNWENKKYREKTINNQRLSTQTPEYRNNCSERQRKLWEDKEYKKQQQKVHIISGEKMWKDEEYRKKLIKGLEQSWENNDVRRDIMKEKIKNSWGNSDVKEKRKRGIKKSWEKRKIGG